ncbi:FRAT-87 protein [Dubosiella newyorkensis]|uniref:FRAT-87 protein n=1 Tax=Dubosiella newyorkensis TaxID=1862672 RepID=UPI0023F382FE|nr:FRAT-87 protein [Dubosiella newyorkensis]
MMMQKKYGQTLADRIDDRIGVIKGWAEKDEKEGKTLDAAVEQDKIAVLEAMKKAL